MPRRLPREKQCADCKANFASLYRSKSKALPDWRFRCEACLNALKTVSGSDYQYGGTWKSRRR
ncbi:MAG: hypothetical protein CBC19_11395 [Oceanospirillales bacterium TMED59]|nr:MAG: hypothetical protein CBC19_11395 [Oceanospirillales bacterium TMED59]